MIILFIMLLVNAAVFMLPNVDPDDKFACNALIDLLFMIFIWAVAVRWGI